MKKRFTDNDSEIVKIYYPHKKNPSHTENINDFQDESDDVKIWNGSKNNIFTE
ncbi:MAG: hypothetical protein J6A58_04230 [Oscillospiraceae bacterium]|nr:hypothetical protein [Oscillospiraceae bacterium]